MRLIWLAAAVALSAPAQVVISQVYGGGGNAGATLTHDFVELFNRGNAAVEMTGWSVQYASATGGVWQVTPISGRIEPGRYFLIRQAAGAGGTQPLPEPDVSGQIPLSATAGKIALARRSTALEGNAPAGDTTVADVVGYGAADWARGMAARALTNTTAALRLRGGCTDTGDNLADFQIAGPAPRNSAAPFNDCQAAVEPPLGVRISQVQGVGATSPLAGLAVTVTGIVTGRRSNGFYVQSLAEDDDSNPDTSEGIFVFLSAAPGASVVNGIVVRVTGTVTEFRPASDPGSPGLTELTSPTVVVTGDARPLPEPAVITTAQLYPAGGAEVLERFEGMRVRFPALRAVSGSGGVIDEVNATARDTGIFWAVLDGTPSPAREPGVDWDGNPERLRVDSGATETVAAGDRWREVTGNLDYSFRAYTLVLDSVAAVEFAPRRAPRVSPALPGDLRIATMNLRRLFDEVDDAGVSDVVLTEAALARRIALIAEAARVDLDRPDVIAVAEAENLAVLRRLAASLGDQYQAFLEEGNDPGGIDVGLLVNTRRIAVESVTQIGKGDSYTTPAGGTAVLHDRPPLVLRAAIDGTRFHLIAVHLRSLINADTPEVRAKRRAQADAIAALAARLQRDYPGEPLAVAGDFNAYSFDDGLVDVVGIISRGAALEVLGAAVPVDQGYTYIQDGNLQILDHVLANAPLAARRSNFEVWHGNTTVPAATPPYSDHDVPVATFRLAGPAPLRLLDSAAWTPGDLAPAQIFSVFGAEVDARSNVEVGGRNAPYWGGATGQVNVEVPRDAVPGLTSIRAAGQEVYRRIVASAPSVFAARVFPGGSVQIVVNGVGAAPSLHFWIDGREAEFIAASGPTVNVRATAGARRGVPVEVLVESDGRVSQRGVMVRLE